ncbi:MAG: Ig-like domain-containing protein [Paenibacillus sp.]|nr:Ig-like domain-containing protein [Paenibacillus sp.]
MKNISKSLSMLMSAALATGLLASCDDDKQLTLNAEEGRMLESINIECSETLKLAVGMDSTLVYTYGPTDVTDPKVYFKSADESIATVDENGTVRGVSVGETTITALSSLGFKVYDAEAVLKVNVIPELIKATEIIIDCETAPSEEGYYYVTDEIQLKATILPADHTYDLLRWASSDESIATVNADGLVTAVGEGEVTIRAIATDRSNVAGEYKFHFYKLVEAERVEIKPVNNPVCISHGAFDLDVTYFPTGATIGAVKWESDDESICKINRGRVTPVGFGTCTISATCPSTGDVQSVTVTVEPGWYIWDASNGWNGWDCSNASQAPQERNDTWRVHFPDAGTGKWRRDIKITNLPFTMHSSHPVMAIRCNVPKGGDNTWDVSDSGNPHDKAGYDLPDGTRLIMMDLTNKFSGWGTPYHEFNLFQVKIADIPNNMVDPSKPWYDIFWIRTFTSADEAKKFAENEVAQGK